MCWETIDVTADIYSLVMEVHIEQTEQPTSTAYILLNPILINEIYI